VVTTFAVFCLARNRTGAAFAPAMRARNAKIVASHPAWMSGRMALCPGAGRPGRVPRHSRLTVISAAIPVEMAFGHRAILEIRRSRLYAHRPQPLPPRRLARRATMKFEIGKGQICATARM